ncbi:hypothetical protein NEOLI_005483, partial [Neolecta irregularis DAH-3]
MVWVSHLRYGGSLYEIYNNEENSYDVTNGSETNLLWLLTFRTFIFALLLFADDADSQRQCGLQTIIKLNEEEVSSRNTTKCVRCWAAHKIPNCAFPHDHDVTSLKYSKYACSFDVGSAVTCNLHSYFIGRPDHQYSLQYFSNQHYLCMVSFAAFTASPDFAATRPYPLHSVHLVANIALVSLDHASPVSPCACSTAMLNCAPAASCSLASPSPPTSTHPSTLPSSPPSLPSLLRERPVEVGVVTAVGVMGFLGSSAGGQGAEQ